MSAPVLSSEPSYNRVAVAPRSHRRYTRKQLSTIYFTTEIASHILGHNFKRPCLQFPDEYVEDGAEVISCIEAELRESNCSVKVFVLADTSYSPCCVDEVAAQHINADVLYHFGNACLNSVRELAVVNVMLGLPLDGDLLVERIKNVGDKTIVYGDTQLTLECAAAAAKAGACCLFPSRGTHIPVFTPPKESHEFLVPNRCIDREISEESLKDYSLVYVCAGEPSASLLLYLSTKVGHIELIDGSKADLPVRSPRTFLQRRYRLVRMAKAAGTIGILVNTVSLKLMTQLLEQVKRWIINADKKHYTFVVGKPNVPKLANFEAIDIWVVLGCPLGGLLVDQNDFYKPVVTPHELYLGLTDTWDGAWTIDLKDTLRLQDPEREDLDDEPYFDPVTGRYLTTHTPLKELRHLEIASEADKALYASSNAVALKATVSTAATYLQNKTWRGLGTDFEGEEESAELKVGRSGVARGYH